LLTKQTGRAHKKDSDQHKPTRPPPKKQSRAETMTTLPPNDFVCPLSNKVMQDPVSTPYGTNFERAAIEGWLLKMPYCPVHRTPLTAAILEANTSLQWKIRFWQWRSKADNEAVSAANEAEKQEKKASPSTSLTSTTPPQRFTCPLTNRIMTDPVLSKTGYSFERVALLQWFTERGNSCPVSGKDLSLSHIVSYAALQHEIQGWKKQQQEEAMSLLYPVVKHVRTTWQVQEPATTVTNSESCHTTIVFPTKTTSCDANKATGTPSSVSTMSMMKGMLLHMQLPSSNNSSNQHCNARKEMETLYQSCNKGTTVLDVLRQVQVTLEEN
jgi:hypothetical protein